jgi:hypothetical protein
MYPSYLVELCEEWTHLAPATAFTRRTFDAITLEILVEQGPRQAWTCKSVPRLAQIFRTQDFGCFLSFLCGLIEAITKWPRYEHDQDPPVKDHAVFSRFAKWTGVIASDFFAIGEDVSVDRLFMTTGMFDYCIYVLTNYFPGTQEGQDLEPCRLL